LGVSRDEGTDAAPEKQQGVVVLLIFRSDEGSTKFERWSAETGQERLVVPKQRSGVQPVNADVAGDAIRPANAIGADDLLLLRIPGEQVVVRLVEAIEIQGPSRALADGAERDLPQAAYLAKRCRDGVGRCAEHAKRAALDEARTVLEAC